MRRRAFGLNGASISCGDWNRRIAGEFDAHLKNKSCLREKADDEKQIVRFFTLLPLLLLLLFLLLIDFLDISFFVIQVLLVEVTTVLLLLLASGSISPLIHGTKDSDGRLIH